MNFHDRSINPIVVLVLILATLWTPDAAASQPASAEANVLAAYAKLPLAFERNQGQVSSEIEYLSRGRDATLFLTGTEAVLQLRRGTSNAAVLRMRLKGANPHPEIAGENLLQGKVNYLIGNDRKKWRTGVPTYRQVRYDEVWPGIDLVWHGTRSALEYDFIVQPGSDPARVRIAFSGTERLRLDRQGNLIARTAVGDVVQNAPVIYQDGPRGRTTINGRYAIKGRREVGFEIGTYDRSKPLIIDPVLNYSTYLGGSAEEDAFAVAADSEGHAYVTGTTTTQNTQGFPGSVDQTFGDVRVFVVKLNADGTDSIYTALIGVGSGPDDISDQSPNGFFDMISNGIAVTADGKACITGGVFTQDNKTDFPLTENAFQGPGIPCFACINIPGRHEDVFVTMLNTQGDDLVYSTFYGDGALALDDLANEVGQAIAVDASQRIYITGRTNSEGLAMRNEFQHHVQRDDAFIAVFDPFLERGNDTLLYASYLGGNGDDIGLGIAVDADRNAYVAGSTASDDLDTTSPAGPPLQATFQGGSFDGFVAKIDTEARGEASLIYFTYFGGDVNDRVEGVAVDAAQRAYITGASNSSPTSFPLLNAFDETQVNGEAFVAKLNDDGTSLFYCSFLGGENGNGTNDGEEGLGIAIDAGGNAYVTGRTTSGQSFPTGPFAPRFPREQQGTAFVAKIEATNFSNTPARLLYATTFGGVRATAHGIALDGLGNVYLAGTTGGTLPTTSGAFQPAFGGGETDAFIVKVDSTLNDTTGIYSLATHEFFLRNSNTSGAADETVNFGDDQEDLPVAGDWDADGQTDLGVFRASTGEFLLRQRQGTTFVTTTVQSSAQSGDLPVIGDFDGDGFDTVGFFGINPAGDPAFLLTNFRVGEAVVAKPELTLVFGREGDLPIAGDWDGDGLDTVGLYRPSTSEFFLVNDFIGGPVISFVFGEAGDLPLAGDWDGDGVDSVGVYSKAASIMHLSDDFGVTERVFRFAELADLPVAGNWDGK